SELYDGVKPHRNFALRTSHFELPSILYHTGDVGRWLTDGTIEFFGRKDYQVKIRGFRIELGEIENKLLNHPQIKEAVVMDRDDETGNKYLCAYVVPHLTYSIDPNSSTQLKDYLTEQLPVYMVPDHFVALPELPLTDNGKIDRKSLPAPGEGVVAIDAAPATNWIEEKIVDIWSEVLGKDKSLIGIDHNFFQLGGHSLKAIVVASKVHKAFDVKLPLVTIFRKPTIRELSLFISESAAAKHTSIEPAEMKDYYPLSSAQKRIYIEQQLNPDSAAYNLPQVINLTEKPDKTKLDQTFLQLIRRHESLRTSFLRVDGLPVQVIHSQVDFVMDHFETGEEEAREIAAGLDRPFDLGKAPLLRAGLFHVDKE
ncbi:MAG: hypothetical protein GY940_47290, partial [bacterium]|nr:hypothetical protein [bacterium]